MTTSYLPHDIECEEGRKKVSYADPLTHGAPFTWGVGCATGCTRAGVEFTDEEIDAQLQRDIQTATVGLDSHFPWWRDLDDIRQDVLVQMVFQMGINGLAHFPRALACMQAENWEGAHDNMMASDWARTQTPARAHREAQQMFSDIRAWS
jgi:GH24 family phage-related lysozyme (muramidase)